MNGIFSIFSSIINVIVSIFISIMNVIFSIHISILNVNDTYAAQYGRDKGD